MKNILLNLANRIAALERADAQKITLGRIAEVDLQTARGNALLKQFLEEELSS